MTNTWMRIDKTEGRRQVGPPKYTFGLFRSAVSQKNGETRKRAKAEYLVVANTKDPIVHSWEKTMKASY